MKIKVSLEMLGRYLSLLVSSYNEQHGGLPEDPSAYTDSIPNLLAHLRHWGDARYLQAALAFLVQKDGLSDGVVDYLCQRSHLDADANELLPILSFLLSQVSNHFGFSPPPDVEIEFIATGEDPRNWAGQRDLLNPNLRWSTHGQDIGGLRCPANSPCPRTGYWSTPAAANSRRHFTQGELMPDLGGDYGQTIWQWDEQP